MTTIRRLNTGILLLLTLTSCQRGGEFLHHVVPEPPDVLNFTHKLKELQGENRVDILWVIDNSGSMYSHQQAVIQNSNVFIQEFVKKAALDWKMGLISTDEAEMPYLGFAAHDLLDSTTPNPVDKFNNAVRRLGTSGSGYEKPFRCVQRALTMQPDFLRKNAILAVIFVTDAEEQSFIAGRDFADFLIQLKGGNPKGVVFYGVLGPTDWGCPPSDSYWNYAGSPYEELAGIVKGKNYPLCSNDFGKNLADLSKDLVKRVTMPRIPLTSRPQIHTLRVTWQGNELKGGPKEEGGLWYYDFELNAILFYDLDFAPGENEEVVVHYEEA